MQEYELDQDRELLKDDAYSEEGQNYHREKSEPVEKLEEIEQLIDGGPVIQVHHLVTIYWRRDSRGRQLPAEN